jgi:hypothetical protein
MRGPVCRWEDNSKTDLNENGRTFVDEINRARDRDRWCTLVDKILNYRVP